MKQRIFFITALCIISVQVLPSLTYNPYTESKALDPSNFHIINNITFYISDIDNSTALDARHECNWGDMKLISFENDDKYNMIVNYILNQTAYSGAPFWTSGRKMMSEWEWSSTGHMFSYTWWSPGQPDNEDTCDAICVLFRATEGWYDSPCDLRRHFMCEY